MVFKQMSEVTISLGGHCQKMDLKEEIGTFHRS